jgi:protein phosphatase methylesterase 1
MQLIQGRPPRFASLAKGIEWCYRSKTVRNLASARVSMPPQLKPDPLAFAASSSSSAAASAEALSSPLSAVSSSSSATFEGPFTWRTDLFATAPHWRGWFTGLSEQFLALPAAKLLLLAGTDRLDKPLMIGQMQVLCQSSE